MSSVWSLAENSVQHKSGLVITILAGSFSNPLDLDVRNGNAYSPVELASLVRQGLSFAGENGNGNVVDQMTAKSTAAVVKVKPANIGAVAGDNKPKRSVLKLKR